MTKKTESRTKVQLDPDNDRRLKEIRKESPLKPSLAKLANLLIRNYAHTLEVEK